jgi:hypothetical protein
MGKKNLWQNSLVTQLRKSINKKQLQVVNNNKKKKSVYLVVF